MDTGDPRRLRGDVNVILNRLVKEGVITSYRTNFDSVTASLAPHVAVTANVVTLSGKKGFDPQRTSEIRRRVARELRALVPDVIVSVREAPANPA